MSAGFVYVAVNPCMPDYCKVGMTTKRPDKRMKGLSGTSVPTDFEARGFVFANDCRAVEKVTHVELSEFRVSRKKEFFTCTPDEAMNVLLSVWSELGETGESIAQAFSEFRFEDAIEDTANGIVRGVA